jgi:hypothetical protein
MIKQVILYCNSLSLDNNNFNNSDNSRIFFNISTESGFFCQHLHFLQCICQNYKEQERIERKRKGGEGMEM